VRYSDKIWFGYISVLHSCNYSFLILNSSFLILNCISLPTKLVNCFYKLFKLISYSLTFQILRFSTIFHKISIFRIKKAAVIIFIIVTAATSYSQMFPSIELGGGPSAGWFFNPVKDLNNELRQAGFPEFRESGYLTLGGSGFVDFSSGKDYYRIGGFGTGFLTKESKKINDSLTKAANYSLGMGGIFVEYVKTFGDVFDIHFGAQFATGELKLELYQYGSSYGNYVNIFGELQSNSSSSNISRVFTSKYYSAQPQAGIGILVKRTYYIKLDAGYHIAAMGKWYVDNDVKVDNFPGGITSKGFTINLGINVGLFFR